MNEFIQNNKNSLQAGGSGNSFGYDLEGEKRRIALGTEELKKEIQDRWNRKYANAQIFPASVEAMHPEVVNFLLAFGLVSVYDNIARQAGLDASGRNALPKIVWQIAQEKNWDGVDAVLETNLPLVHSVHIQVVNLLKQEILDKIQAISEKPVAQKTFIEEEKKKEIELPLAKALEQYPKVGEQNITLNQLKLRIIPTPVRPSIKNWVTDFFDVMGAKKHSPIDRGNFLFHSENGKKLSASERQKLATILKSLDEETLLTIDVEEGKVVFKNSEEEEDARTIMTSLPDGQTNRQPAYRADISSTIKSYQATEKPNTFQKAENIAKEIPEIVPVTPLPKKDLQEPGMKNEEKVETFFEIPGSKPPIGSEDFFVKPKEVVEEKKDPENMSDDELLEQLRKNNAKKAAAGFSPNFAANDGKISFSSPQKFSAEQSVKPAFPNPLTQNKIQQQSSPQTNQSQKSPFHIIPTGFAHEEKDALPRIQRNVVDLKN